MRLHGIHALSPSSPPSASSPPILPAQRFPAAADPERCDRPRLTLAGHYRALSFEGFHRALLKLVMADDELEPGRRLDWFRKHDPDGPHTVEELALALGVKSSFSVQRWVRYRRSVAATKKAGPPGPRQRVTIWELVGIPKGHWKSRAGASR